MNKIIIFIFASFFTLLSFADERIIAVEGNGTIESTPDIIRISYNVSDISKDDVAKAKSKVDKISSLSIARLIDLGVIENDITSSSLNVETIEEYDENDNPSIKGSVVRREIDIVLRDINLYNSVIQALVDIEVSEIQSVNPDVSNYEALKRKALAIAAKNAKENAEFLANEFGAKIHKVHQIGKQNIRRHFSLEEVVVTAQRRMAPNITSTLYEFKPGNVKVYSSVYVEFVIR